MGQEVRIASGVPVVANFAMGVGAPSTPIVIDSSTGKAYYLGASAGVAVVKVIKGG